MLGEREVKFQVAERKTLQVPSRATNDKQKPATSNDEKSDIICWTESRGKRAEWAKKRHSSMKIWKIKHSQLQIAYPEIDSNYSQHSIFEWMCSWINECMFCSPDIFANFDFSTNCICLPFYWALSRTFDVSIRHSRRDMKTTLFFSLRRRHHDADDDFFEGEEIR